MAYRKRDESYSACIRVNSELWHQIQRRPGRSTNAKIKALIKLGLEAMAPQQQKAA